MRWWPCCLLACGCAPEGDPDLVAELTGSWTGDLWFATLERDPMVLLMGPADRGERGRVHVSQPDADREYVLERAVGVDDVGVVLDFFEDGGVRRLELTALAPLDPLVLGWDATWYCEEHPERDCEERGTASLDRVHP